jgi:hypothetical protein
MSASTTPVAFPIILTVPAQPLKVTTTAQKNKTLIAFFMKFPQLG